MRISKEKEELTWRVGGLGILDRKERLRWLDGIKTSTRLALVWPLPPTAQDEFGA